MCLRAPPSALVCIHPKWVASFPLSCHASVYVPAFRLFTPPAEILPKHFGWPTVFSGRPKLERWWAAVQKDAEAARVRACVLAMQLF